MFEISWSELLILAVVTLIFVGPKDLPKFLSTLGRYAGMVRRQAAEFRAQFDEAMRQAELDALKKEVEDVRSGIQDAVREAPAPQQPATTVTSAQPAPAQPAAVPAPEAAPLQVTLPLGRTAEEVKQSAAAQTKTAMAEATPREAAKAEPAQTEAPGAASNAAKPDEPKGP